MNANSLETVGERVQAYLDEALSLQALSAWLLSKTAYFADASRLGRISPMMPDCGHERAI